LILQGVGNHANRFDKRREGEIALKGTEEIVDIKERACPVCEELSVDGDDSGERIPDNREDLRLRWKGTLDRNIGEGVALFRRKFGPGQSGKPRLQDCGAKRCTRRSWYSHIGECPLLGHEVSRLRPEAALDEGCPGEQHSHDGVPHPRKTRSMGGYVKTRNVTQELSTLVIKIITAVVKMPVHRQAPHKIRDLFYFHSSG